MRILMWVRSAFPYIGGIERVTDQLTKALIARGHIVATIAGMPKPARDERDEARLGKIWYVNFVESLANRDLAKVFASIDRINTIIQDFAPDVIHFHPSGVECFVFNLIRKQMSVPVLTTVHLDGDQLYSKRRENSIATTLRNASKVTSVSQAVQEKFARLLPELGPITVITNAIPENSAPFSPAHGNQILAFGRIIHDKGFDLALEALPTILKSVPDAKLVFAGNGPELDNLKARTEELGLSPHVEFPGWIAPEDIADTIRQSALVIVPSRWAEPFGMTALEAAAVGRPAVVTRCGGLPEIVVDGQTGFVVPPENPDAIAAAALRILEDPALAESIGRAARERARTQFNLERCVDRYEEVYKTILPGHVA